MGIHREHHSPRRRKVALASGKHRQASQRGGASVEQVGLLGLVAIVFVAVAAVLASEGAVDTGRELGGTIGRRITCAPLLPDYCRRNPLAPAYGTRIGKAVRGLAPRPSTMHRDGLVPVDFRYCRQVSCATPIEGERSDRLTASNRRITAYTEVIDRRRAENVVEIRYWLYRPTQAWELRTRVVGPGLLEGAQSTRLGLDYSPRLVPLETLAGRNHEEFRVVEEPPWRWRVEPVFNGRPT